MSMDRQTIPAQNELEFLLSLLKITNPGQPASQQSNAIEQLLPVAATR